MVEYYRSPRVSLDPVHRGWGNYLLWIYSISGLLMGINKPNYTQIPNLILDNIHKYSLPEFKILIFICRKTFGWHKKKDRIAYSQIIKGTGLGKNTVPRAVNLLKENGYLIQSGSPHTGYSYELSINGVTPLRVQSDPIEGIDKPQIDPTVGTTKERVKKLTKEKGSSDLKILTSLYTQLYKAKYNLPPNNYSLITKKTKDVLTVRDLAYIQGALKAYFADPDSFIEKQSHSMQFFVSKIDFWGKKIEKPNPRDNKAQLLKEITP